MINYPWFIGTSDNYPYNWTHENIFIYTIRIIPPPPELIVVLENRKKPHRSHDFNSPIKSQPPGISHVTVGGGGGCQTELNDA